MGSSPMNAPTNINTTTTTTNITNVASQLRSNAMLGVSQLIDRARLWLAGVQYGGKRDLYSIFGYKRYPHMQDYLGHYCRQPLAKRIVDAPIDSTWVDPPVLESDDAKFLKAWEDMVTSVPVFHFLGRL